MKIILSAIFVVILLSAAALGGPGTVKTNAGTFTQTNVLFKSPETAKDIGGGYTISTGASGDEKTSLDFETNSNFHFDEGRTISINTGANTLASGAKTFGMMAALTQTYPTENGYRSSVFQTHSYTFMPYLFSINQVTKGDISDDGAGGSNNNELWFGDQKYEFGASSKLDDSLTNEEAYDPSIAAVSGLGWENGFDYINTVNECGLDYTGTLSTDSTLLVG